MVTSWAMFANKPFSKLAECFAHPWVFNDEWLYTMQEARNYTTSSIHSVPQGLCETELSSAPSIGNPSCLSCGWTTTQLWGLVTDPLISWGFGITIYLFTPKANVTLIPLIDEATHYSLVLIWYHFPVSLTIHHIEHTRWFVNHGMIQ